MLQFAIGRVMATDSRALNEIKEVLESAKNDTSEAFVNEYVQFLIACRESKPRRM